MMQYGDALISLDAANPDASPLRQAYARWWESPRPVFAHIAAGLIRLANRLAPAPNPKAAPSEVTDKRITAARAAGQP